MKNAEKGRLEQIEFAVLLHFLVDCLEVSELGELKEKLGDYSGIHGSFGKTELKGEFAVRKTKKIKFSGSVVLTNWARNQSKEKQLLFSVVWLLKS